MQKIIFLLSKKLKNTESAQLWFKNSTASWYHRALARTASEAFI